MKLPEPDDNILYTEKIKKLNGIAASGNMYRQHVSMPSCCRAHGLMREAKFSRRTSHPAVHIIGERKKKNLYRIVAEEIPISSMSKAEGNVLSDRMALEILWHDLLIHILLSLFTR